MSSSRVVRYRDGAWEGVAARSYAATPGSHRGVLRHTLAGRSAEDEGVSFETRYFHVDAGGRTSLERHEHAHTVVVLAGRGRVRLDDRVEPLAPFDLVYVAPGEAHRFEADAEEALGFLCIVDRERDHPTPVDPTSFGLSE